MKLEQQIQLLIKDAANYGIAPVVIEKAIAPILKSLAEKLQHLEYFVLQNLEEDWIISVISSRQAQDREKKVIYAFTTVKDAKNFSPNQDADFVAVSVPVVQILFRIFALKQVESIIFFPQAGNINQGVEIQCRDLQNAIQNELLRLSTMPPNLA